MADVVARRIVVRPRSGGIGRRERLHVAAGDDYLMVGERAIGRGAFGEARWDDQRVVLKRRMALVDAAIYNRDLHAQARSLISAQRVPCPLRVHQYGGA